MGGAGNGKVCERVESPESHQRMGWFASATTPTCLDDRDLRVRFHVQLPEPPTAGTSLMRLIRFPVSALMGFVRINPWLAVVIGMIVLTVFNLVAARFHAMAFLAAAVQIVGLLLGLVLAARIGRPTEADPIVRSRVARRACGACGYNLGAIASGGDGRTVCPECGAAWELPATQEKILGHERSASRPAGCAARL